MTTFTPLSEITDRELMERLDADPGKNRLIREVERRIAPILETATRFLPDAEVGYYEARNIIVSPAGVAYFLDKWRTGLAQYSYGVARSDEVRTAGLAGKKRMRNDPMYGTRASSIEALSADGWEFAAPTPDTRALEEVEADERARIRDLREAFTQVASGVLTERQVQVILAYANLHKDNALPEMNTQEQVAKTLRISQQAVSRHIAAARENAKLFPVLTIAIRELCGDDEGAAKTVEKLLVEA